MEIRQPYVERYANSITKEDGYVSITGIVVNRGEGVLVIDDGTGQAEVFIESNLESNYVRILGQVISANPVQLQGHIMQDMSKLDKKLYHKVKELLTN